MFRHMHCYRIGSAADRTAIERLWQEETDWGHLADLHWKAWYEPNPYGEPVPILMTETNDEVAGQIVFLPSLVSVRGRVMAACHPFAPILRKGVRGFRGTDL